MTIEQLIARKLILSDVPGEYRFPTGRWRQQPDDAGPAATRGQWWYSGGAIDFTTGGKPWIRFQDDAAPEESLPVGFVELFGARPSRKMEEYRDVPSVVLDNAILLWGRRLKNFVHYDGSLPEWISQAQLTAGQAEWERWGLGEAKVFEQKSGWWLIFPDAEFLPRYMQGASVVFDSPHLDGIEQVVITYQIDLLQMGITPDPIHSSVRAIGVG